MDDEQRRSQQRQRNRSRLAHNLHANHVPPERRRVSRRQHIISGALIGTLAYLVTSCFDGYGLHKPKDERRSDL